MSFVTQSAMETRRLGEYLGRLMKAGDVVLLDGTLGAGKTTFVQGVARGLGVHGDVTSPTFTLVAEYAGRVPVAHMDLYRLQPSPGTGAALAEGDLAAIGMDDYLDGSHAVLVEWPGDLVETVADALHVEIVPRPLPHVDERELHCRASGARSWEILDEWVKEWLF
ncbi:MAG: tRNA (adenosine(37)-N6)-threonylcarbamoyltransferase complex ATPase subunit type 1 TsaE [Alicyclobacillus sp.]|nr:tRNA (adenosine(37)-N6)-threonylcarbamoyltransferase complex ATPase subunit type 1 TsaE [Alicyclobacillus sp.]